MMAVLSPDPPGGELLIIWCLLAACDVVVLAGRVILLQLGADPKCWVQLSKSRFKDFCCSDLSVKL